MSFRFNRVLFAFLLIHAPVWAQDSKNSEPDEKPTEITEEQKKIEQQSIRKLTRITVTGDSADKVPGSAHVLEGKELEKVNTGFNDISRILRNVPGVNVQEEDGFGLRPNIGFRGTSVERSANITLMEDSVLAAPAPYAAPAAYYFPTAGRMEGMEILKGASQVKYGPRTVGGSLNLFSTKIPSKFRVRSDVRFGDENTLIGHLNVGDSQKNFGYLLETYQANTNGFKDLDNGGDTGYDLQDYMTKLRFNTDPSAPMYQELEVKLGYYDQFANETYLGLTDADFEATPFRRYAGSQRDNLDLNHRLYQVTHYAEVSSKVDVTTTVYRTEAERDWFKLDTVNGVSTADILSDPNTYSNEMSWIRGGNSPADALALRHNDREYYAAGVQSVLGYKIQGGDVEHDVEFGVRYHQDEEDRFQNEENFQMLNGSMVLTSVDELGTAGNRINKADAWAFFVQDEVSYKKLKVTPGVRVESINLTRKDYGSEDPNRTGANLNQDSNTLNVVIPGVGAFYEMTPELGVFGGVHKGFSPPGPSEGDVKEEESVNYELGTSYRKNSFDAELVGFFSDYSNLLGEDTLSGGGAGTGDLFNAGAAEVWGFESSAGYNLASTWQSKLAVPARLTYTYTNATFRDDFDSELFGLVSSGDSLPYIPENQLSLSLGLEEPELWGVYLLGHYVDAMPTVAGQSGTVSTLETDSYFVFDLRGEIKVSQTTKLYAMVQNLFDEEYAVARRPAGARPGMPQTFLAGIKLDLF